jgi:hypothetical protein
MMHRLLLLWLLFAVVVSVPFDASADAAFDASADALVPLRVKYLGAPGCPTEERFVSRIVALSDRIRVAVPGESARAFEVSLERTSASPSQIHGVARHVGETDGLSLDAGATDPEAAGARTITGANCEEVASALALSVALSIDPYARFEPKAAPAAPTLPKPAPVADPGFARGAPRPPEPQLGQWTARAHGFVATPSDLGVVGGQAGLAFEFPIAPSWRLGTALVVARGQGPLTVTDPLALAWTSAELDVCPWALQGATYGLRTCAEVEGGLLEVRGGARPSVSTARQSVWLLGGGVQGTALLGDMFGLETLFSAGIPLYGRRFILEDPRQLATRTPNLSVKCALGIFFRIP